MKIQDFISETLCEISEGVRRATQDKSIEVCPRCLFDENAKTAGQFLVSMHSKHPVTVIEFDLSVIVQSKIGGQARAGLEVLGFGGKTDVTAGIDHTRVQRIKFQIPVAFKPKMD